MKKLSSHNRLISKDKTKNKNKKHDCLNRFVPSTPDLLFNEPKVCGVFKGLQFDFLSDCYFLIVGKENPLVTLCLHDAE